MLLLLLLLQLKLLQPLTQAADTAAGAFLLPWPALLKLLPLIPVLKTAVAGDASVAVAAAAETVAASDASC
jgi:hypothetical protein